MPADLGTPVGAGPDGLEASPCPETSPAPQAGPALAGVIFDMDGVIVDSEPLSMGTLAEMAAERGIHLEPALLDELIGVSLEDVLDILAVRLDPGLAAAGIDAGQLRRDYHERYLPRLREAAVPTPGLERLVRGLAASGVPVAIASSSTLAEIDAVVSALGLRSVLRAVASGEEVARHKPAPDVYRLAIERLGAGPAGLVAIEDSATGVAAATAAGLVCVAVRTTVTRGHDFGRAALVAGSLEELDVGILGRLVQDRPARD